MKIIGHRGARGLAPENTITSLQKAVEHHVDEIEFDLRVTKDGVVILHHDPDVSDRSGQKLNIVKSSYQALLEHKPDLPTFEQALDALGKDPHLYIEVKPGVSLQPIVKIVRAYLAKGWTSKNMKLGSFSQQVLLQLQKDLPEIDKIVIEKWSGIRAGHRARQLGTKYISMNQKWLWWGFIRQVSRGGWKLYTYTLNNADKAKRWEKYGLYGVVTDYPDRFEKK